MNIKFNKKQKLILKESNDETVDIIKTQIETSQVSIDNLQSGIAAMINALIIDEWQAVDGYNSTISTLKDNIDSMNDQVLIDKFNTMISILKDIVDEEMIHVGQLQVALSMVQNNVSSIDNGVKEADDQVNAEAESRYDLDTAENNSTEVEEISDIDDSNTEIKEESLKRSERKHDFKVERKKCVEKKSMKNLFSQDDAEINLERIEQLKQLYIAEPGDLTEDELQELIDAGVDLDELDKLTSKREEKSRDLKKNTSLDEGFGSYVEYNPEDGWTDEDIAKHKEIDWEARNYEEFDAGDAFKGKVYIYRYDADTEVKDDITFHKFLRANPIYSPYYRPVELNIEGVVGPMYDGRKHKTYGIHDRYEDTKTYDLLSDSLEEDTVKKGNKWVNKGKEGTHGEFKTKKAADAQRKAMFANGYKAESVETDNLEEQDLKKTSKMLYQFPELNEKDKELLSNFNLNIEAIVTKDYEYGSKGDLIVSGTKEDLESFASMIDYELHPDYLYDFDYYDFKYLEAEGLIKRVGFNLPDKIIIYLDELNIDEDIIKDDISDDEKEEIISNGISEYLSNVYGFTHYGFEFKKGDNGEIEVYNIRWDTSESLKKSKKTKKISYEDALTKLYSGDWDNERFNDAIMSGEVEEPKNDFLTEGKWKHKISKESHELHDAIEEGTIEEVKTKAIKVLEKCKEFFDEDKDDGVIIEIEDLIATFENFECEDCDDEEEINDAMDFHLSELYDFCDGFGIWLEI